jgi:hypothetical protein
LNKKIINYKKSGIDISISEKLLNSANISFNNGQIQDAYNFVDQTKSQIETDVASASSIGVLANNAKNFLYRYIYFIVPAIILIILLSYFVVKYIKLRLLKNKIFKMEVEEKVLNNLIIKNQTERYKLNKISELTYKIRAGKYQSRLVDIKQELPVLKSRLKK